MGSRLPFALDHRFLSFKTKILCFFFLNNSFDHIPNVNLIKVVVPVKVWVGGRQPRARLISCWPWGDRHGASGAPWGPV